jgi:hypothetical protein
MPDVLEPEQAPIRIPEEVSKAREVVWETEFDEVVAALAAHRDGGCDLSFVADAVPFLAVKVEISGPRELAWIEYVEVDGEQDRRLRWMLDARRYDETRRLFVSGVDDGYPFAGSYDPRRQRGTVDVSLASWLREPALEHIVPLRDRLQGELVGDWESRAGTYADEVNDLLAHSHFREHLEAACWALFGGIGSLGTEVARADLPGHYLEAARVTLLAAAGYAAAMCAKASQRHGGASPTST